MKQSHDKLFIRNMWTYQGWSQRLIFIFGSFPVIAASIKGWIYILK